MFWSAARLGFPILCVSPSHSCRTLSAYICVICGSSFPGAFWTGLSGDIHVSVCSPVEIPILCVSPSHCVLLHCCNRPVALWFNWLIPYLRTSASSADLRPRGLSGRDCLGTFVFRSAVLSEFQYYVCPRCTVASPLHCGICGSSSPGPVWNSLSCVCPRCSSLVFSDVCTGRSSDVRTCRPMPPRKVWTEKKALPADGSVRLCIRR
jgi:hypothetical protein